MRKRLKEKGVIPHGGGFNVRHPELGIVGGGTTWKMFLASAKRYRIANELPIGLEFEIEAENAACLDHPAECEDDNPHEPRPARNMSYKDVVLGTQVMLRLAASGFKLVDHAEAERRAAICATCPMNVTFSKPCGGICGALEAMIRTIGAKPTSYHNALNSCFICGCYLNAAIHVPLDIQVPPLTDNQKIRFQAQNEAHGCWKVIKG